ncbi:wd g-beta repeat-containing protein, partial [Cystoisospora suis]
GEERYGEAIVLLTRALRQTSDPQLRVPLLCNRAHALIKRAARGDDLAAEKDAIEAAYLIPSNPKTHYRRIQALRATRRPFAAFRLARACKKKFPGVPDFTRVMREIARD